MTPVTETFVVHQWTGACGPPPVSGVLHPRDKATLRDDGGELTITVGGHALRTDRCVDPLPTLAPESHSSDGHTWRTRCVTPPGDARHAVVNTAYFLTAAGAITMAETGRYEFAIRGARCVADVTRGSSIFQLLPVGSATVAPSSVSPLPAPSGSLPPAPSAATATSPSVLPSGIGSGPPASPSSGPNEGPCDHPDEPARLEVRPSRKLVRLGAEYRFHAKVLDAKNCPTTTSIQWSVGAVRTGDGKPASVQPSIDSVGVLTVPLGGISGARFDVVATAAGRSAHASVEVTSAANFESLLAQSGLDSNGERGEPSVAILATTSLGASDARTHDGARERRIVFILIVAGLASTLGAVALFAAIRARKVRQVERAARARHAERMREYEHRKRERETRHAAQTRAHVESVALAQQATAAAAATVGSGSTGPLFCPSCHREFSAGSIYCPFDANRLVMLAGHEQIAAGPPGSICPTCHRGYNPGVRACPHDGDELVPGPMLGPPAAVARGKICPTCGGRFEGTAGFCGKDGTQLVLLN